MTVYTKYMNICIYIYMYMCIYIYMHTLCMRAFDLLPFRPNLNVDVRRAAAAGEAAAPYEEELSRHQH